jgi:hypothetical protein
MPLFIAMTPLLKGSLLLKYAFVGEWFGVLGITER